MSWRFHLLSLPDRTWIDRDVPLQGAQVAGAYSAPATITGNLPLGYAFNRPDGTPWTLAEGGALLVAEQEGRKPVSGIVDHVEADAEGTLVEAGGFTTYPHGQPWTGPEYVGIQVDPLDMVRKIWGHLQSYPDGDLRVAVDSTTSPVRIGTEEEETEFTTGDGEDVAFTSGPYRLAWWQTDDLGEELDALMGDTPFGYREHSAWDGEAITHRLELGYPGLGARLNHLRFEIGVNVLVAPVAEGADYATEVRVYGAGEGRTKPQGIATSPAARLRRVHTVTDKSITSNRAASKAAAALLKTLAGGQEFTELSVLDHPNAPRGSFQPGDEIRVKGDAGWGEVDRWVRVAEITTDCTTGAMTLKVGDA